MLSNVWMKHFNLLVVVVVVMGLAVGAGLAATFTQPAPAVVAQPARTAGGFAGQSNGGGASQGTAAGQGASTQAGAAAGSRPIFGSVGSVTADTLTVKDQQGDVNVKLSGAKVLKTVDATVADLKAGETVTVVGQQESNGNYTASSVQILAANQPQRGTTNAQGNSGAAAQSGGNRGQGQQANQTRTRPLTGSVKSVDNGVLTMSVQTDDVKVNLASAKIEKTVDGTTKDLQSGQQVVVTGQQGSDGSYAASEIQILPAGSGTTAGSAATAARGARSSSAQPAPTPTATK